MSLPIEDLSAFQGLEQEVAKFRDLKQKVTDGKCLAFVGSGPSWGFYPKWPDLVKELCDTCGVDANSNLTSEPDRLMELATKARNSDPDSYDKHIRSTFGGTATQTSLVYGCLMNIPFYSYLTLNFDPLLATARQLHNHNSDTNDFYRYPYLNVFHLKNKAVFYLHGWVRKDESPLKIVLCKEDFDEAYKLGSDLSELLGMTFKYKDICFIGCELNEGPLKELLSRCAKFKEGFFQTRGRNTPKHTILLPRPATPSKNTNPDIDTKHLNQGIKRQYQENILKTEQTYGKMGISVLWYHRRDDKFSGLVELLKNMAELKPIQPKSFEGVYDAQ